MRAVPCDQRTSVAEHWLVLNVVNKQSLHCWLCS